MFPRRLAALAALLMVAAPLPAATSHASPPPKPGSYYLALGDSLAYGITANGVPGDPQCKSADAPGYVCVFYRYLQQINPQIQLQNLGVPGLDSCELLHGYLGSSPCTRQLDTGQIGAPLTAAAQFLQAHQGQVSPITINIGANDLLPLLPEAAQNPSAVLLKLPDVMRNYQANLDVALATLRTDAPDAEIIISTQYNPLGGIGSPPLPSGLPEAAKNAIDSMNRIIVQEAQKHNIVVADAAAAFDKNPGGATFLTYVPTTIAGGTSQINVHATPDGYKVWAQTLIAASGYVLPLKLTARVSRKQVPRGAQERVSGTASAGATLQVRVWRPQQKRHIFVASVGSNGKFTASFGVGKKQGKGAVQVCASDAAGQSLCSAKMAYTVR